MRLQDKVCLITGGAAGIGKATAIRFAEEGAKVVICDVNRAAGEELARQLGPDASFYAVDTTNRAEVQAWVDDVVAKYGRVDVLVNNAGITKDALFVKVKDGELVKQMEELAFDQVISVKYKRCIQLRAGRGRLHDQARRRRDPECLLGSRPVRQPGSDQLRGHQGGCDRHDQGVGA